MEPTQPPPGTRSLRGRIGDLANAILAPLGLSLVARSSVGEPSATALRLRLFRQIAAKGLRPKHIVDVGAHKAGWSADARTVFGDCAFTLIEPQEELAPYLNAFCSEAKSAKWILAGAGAELGELPLTLSPQLDGRSLTHSEAEAKEQGYEQRIVPVVTLDSVCAESSWPTPEIVKIDAEGMDLDVVRGAQSLVGTTELFFLELPLFDFSQTESIHSIIAAMREYGYEPYDLTDLNRRTSDSALGLVEMAFAKRSGVLRDQHGW